MLVHVLGSAAGGGFPQWNCGCPNCEGVRARRIAASPRTQESAAVSADGRGWIVLNASPDARAQIEACPALHPRRARHTPIAGIVLTSGDVDHCVGLFSLRESEPLVVHATEAVWRAFSERNVLARTLARFPGHVTWRRLEPGAPTVVCGLEIEPVPVPGKLPIHLEDVARPDPADTIGLRIRDTAAGTRLAYFPGVAAITDAVRAALADADCVFLDGTFWSSDELLALRLGARRAEQMGHVPVGGEHGSVRALAGLRAKRRILIHVNNTNPLLRDDSPERAEVGAAGWEVARDGMEVHA